MLRVGLTGGPGSGKSTVAGILAAGGFPVIDADKVANRLYRAGSALVAELGREFGAEVVAADGGIDRTALGNLVFGHQERLDRLNRIVHPRLLRELSRGLGDLEDRGEPVGVLEAALLLQWGPTQFVDLVVGVVADRSIRARRLIESGLTPEAAERRLASHPGDDPDAMDIVVPNEGTLADLALRVQELGRELRERAGIPGS